MNKHHGRVLNISYLIWFWEYTEVS